MKNMKNALKVSLLILSFVLVFALVGCSSSNNTHVNYSLDVTFSDEGGTITKSPDKNFYKSGESVTLTAQANDGYVFVYWTENGFEELKDEKVTITMLDDVNLLAYFGQYYEIEDDFSTGDNWRIRESEISSSQIENGKYALTIKIATGILWEKRGAFSPKGDFNANTTFQFKSSASDNYAQAGFGFNIEDKYNYYTLRINSSGNYSIQRKVDDDKTIIKDWTTHNIDDIDGKYLISVNKTDKKYTFNLNGDFLDEVVVEEDIPSITLLAASKNDYPITVYYNNFYGNYVNLLSLPETVAN